MSMFMLLPLVLIVNTIIIYCGSSYNKIQGKRFNSIGKDSIGLLEKDKELEFRGTKSMFQLLLS